MNNRIEQIRGMAEGYFDRGEFFCSEAVLHSINQFLGCPMPEEITRLASGFPIGLGKCGCLCGAVSGGEMALGLVYGRTHGETMNENMFPAAAELHDHIKNKYGSTCCRVLVKDFDFATPERKRHCVKITGEVAAWIAERLLQDESVKERIISAEPLND